MAEIDEIGKEAERIEEDALFSARGHFEASRAWARLHYWIGVPTTVAAAVAGASIIAGAPLLAGLLSVSAATLAALQTFLNPSKRAQHHHTVGTQFNSLRNEARLFRNVQLGVQNTVDAQSTLTKLASNHNSLNEGAPPIPRKAFERGRASIERGEASYQVDGRVAGSLENDTT